MQRQQHNKLTKAKIISNAHTTTTITITITREDVEMEIMAEAEETEVSTEETAQKRRIFYQKTPARRKNKSGWGKS